MTTTEGLAKPSENHEGAGTAIERLRANPSDLLGFLGRLLQNIVICLSVQLSGWLAGRGWLGKVLSLALYQTLGPDVPGKKLADEPEATIRNKVLPVVDPLRARFIQLRLDTKLARENRYSRVLLLGQGNTGKTEFLRWLLSYSGSDRGRPRPAVKTGNTNTYFALRQASFGDVNQCILFEVNDYKGQSTIQYLTELKSTPEQKASIDAIVLIVDLFRGNGHEKEDDQRPKEYQTEFDLVRIQEQIKYWTGEMLAASIQINGKADRPQYFCLFINKIDVLRPLLPGAEDAAEAAYSALYTEILRQSSSVGVKCLVGSMSEGTSVPDLMEILISAAEKVNIS